MKQTITQILPQGWIGLVFILALVSVVSFSGCATPHRKTVSTHTLETFQGRPDGLVAREQWRDQDSGGALFLFEDPTSAGMCIKHTNQTSIGGSSWMMIAPFSMVVDSNLVPAIAATGTAVGNIAGSAAKAAVK